jgi:oligosaccharide repeat unit polymerase
MFDRSSVGGVIAISVGIFWAIIFVPENPAPAGAMTVSAAILAVAVVWYPALRLLQGPLVAFRAENFLMVGLIYWLLLDPIQSAYDLDVSQFTARLAILAVGLTAVAIWTGAAVRVWTVPAVLKRELQSQWSPVLLFRMSVLCFVLGMLTYAIPTDFDVIEMVSYIGEARWEAPWVRGQLGGVDAFWDHLQYFGYVLPVLYVAYAREKGWFHPKALIILAMAVAFLAFLSQGGGRRVVGVTVGAAILFRLMSFERLQVRTVVTVVVASLGLLYFMQQMLIYRGVGWFEEVEVSYHHIHVDDNFLRLGQVIELIPDEHPFVGSKLLVYTFVRPVPRLIWPGKPVDPGFDLAATVDGRGASLSMSMIGEWYVTFGFIAVIFGGLFFGSLCAFVNQMARLQKPGATSLVIPTAIMVLFAGLRSLQDLVIMSYAVLGWLALTALINKFRWKQPVDRIAQRFG